MATAAPLTVRCTTAPVGVSVTKYGGTCPDLTYVLTGGPAGHRAGATSGRAVAGPPWCGGWLTVTTVITIAITASAAASGASRGAQVDHVARGERAPRRRRPKRRVRAAGSSSGGTLSGATVSAAARAAARIRSSIRFMTAVPPGSGRARPARATWWT